MNWWDRRVVPRLVELSCGGSTAERWRRRAVARPQVRGIVLEVGFGSGRNLRHYSETVTTVLAVEPSDLAWDLARERVAGFGRPVERIGVDAARLDLPDDSVDAVVSTWTLCTIPDWHEALTEFRRVLRPGGAISFVEHTISPRPRVAAAERAVQPLWGRIAGGCHVDRDIPGELERAAYTLCDRHDRGWFVSGVAHPTDPV